ncbi:sulfur-oxidizing protein SoxY [Methylobacterium sp. PvP062]|jgi:sulfur-oxidizing protein SoxY|uniref:Ig-like SoxY domain-containing protein n=3 Tax=Methylobacterium TaxID=407 RepID=A0A509EBQ7_9HYPH|nr:MULTISPECIES: thiosulfate oxidation carrier protein SoxY [Methylobacterium]MCX7333337.1 thiosulfate oxidation carrier protein SoxY [Hyphomicrobiales bacterium]GAN46064.1 sulfur oxidation protein SoxY [Methylobacterium sp. ME121]MBN6818425.1 thiosulfate oxidation carrier protein SoxY [Methylobacterium organophilum]MBP2492841.1 sulfur-oxidizing protein SoxY [Methylobacterium sp. PvP105]MBP2500787.1 sulfur-oxidizing protein SoxY [Methylobacterium sp. PvP109]
MTSAKIPAMSRRQALAFGTGAMVATAFAFRAGPALAAKPATDEAIKAFTRGKEPVKGRVKLELPEIAENGNTVPMTVSVDGPMTAESYVEEVMIVAEGNPNPGVISFHFTPSSVAEANTRIRLAETQNVIAVARMNDGSVFSDVRQVKVTIGGCGG